MSRIFKVRIVATKTMWVTQDDINEDAAGGMIAAPSRELDSKLR